MSGICGVVRIDGAPADPDWLKAIAEKAPYRMGGGVEYSLQGSIGLAYLTSPPISTSSSGLCSSDRLIVAADARLDNPNELAHLLVAGGCLPAGTPTDLELILAAFTCWGPGCCERLQGAYSLACWDKANSSLILLRDRLGERPLYWCSTPQAFFFASEPAQLLSVESIDSALNPERMLAHLLKQPFDPAWSFFRAIHRLPEAHLLTLKHHQTTVQRYWSPRSILQAEWDHLKAAEALSLALEQAVARRMSKNGETGVLLSGGLDSSSVAAKASAILERQAKQLFAFTWESRSGDPLDERRWSTALIGARPNLVEHPVLADELYPLSRYPEAYADPNAPDTNSYPDLLLQTIETARQQGVQVLMNGIGGDLVIGGVLPELALLFQGRWGVLAQRLRRSGRRTLRMLIRQSRMAARVYFPPWISSEGRRLAHQAELDHPAPWIKEMKSPLSLRAHLLTQPLNAMALERFDRLSARYGVRIVAPWHDLGLLSLVLSLSDGALDLHPPGKSLLRQALASELPETLLTLPASKDRVSSLPSDGLLRHGRERIVGWLSQSLLGELGLVDPPSLLSAYLQAAQSSRITPGIWEVITLEIWLHIHYNMASLPNPLLSLAAQKN